MRCSSCHRWLHALCSSPAALTPTDYPSDQDWSCPCCGANNTVSTDKNCMGTVCNEVLVGSWSARDWFIWLGIVWVSTRGVG